MKKVIEGTSAAAYAVRDCGVEVIAAYPITPQTSIVETLAYFCATGELDAEFIQVESEHSAMAACIAACAGGARVFTATSSHGLALMHELLHWASRGRLPIVMVNANRALAVPWNIGAELTDSLSQRDTGWIQLYCSNNQEVYDYVVQSFALSHAVRLPVMVNMEAFTLSHTSELVDLPEMDRVKTFLQPYPPVDLLPLDDPAALFGGVPDGERYTQFQKGVQADMDSVFETFPNIQKEFLKVFGRKHEILASQCIDDASTILVTAGTISNTAQSILTEARSKGIDLGLIDIKLFRPFPTEEIRHVLSRAKKVAVIDRDISLGAGGIFAQEVKSSLCSAGLRPEFYCFIAGLGGKDVTPGTIEWIVDFTQKEQGKDLIWV
jgi:pyruvate/2-oxoacid:ferredoxin oxidoreductase alpha subunit